MVLCMAKILVVEDDDDLRSNLQEWLTREHHIVDAAGDGNDGLAFARSSQYDVLVLDWELPGMSGLDICKQYRSKGGTAPILFLTGRKEIGDKVAGLESGADDYLTKPFHVQELMVRIKALLRRPQTLGGELLKAGDLVLDTKNYTVSRDNKPIHLPRMEFALLEFFMRHQGHVFSAETLLERVWPAESERSPESLRTSLKKLRDKIDVKGEPSLIKNIHGVGYKLESN